MSNCEHINPYEGDTRHKGAQVEDMFDNIAPAYDFMNRAMTLGIDNRWRRRAVEMMARQHPQAILDVATGTGDLALMMARAMPDATVTGVDLSRGMIEVGERKIEAAGLAARIKLEQADSLALPMADNTFDCVSVAYGVRNFEDLAKGYSEMTRVLRPGGMLCVIELSTPTSALVRPLYKLYTRHVIPMVGRIVSRDVRAYSYLPESIAAVPQGEAMLQLMRDAGLRDTAYTPLTFGVCTIYTGVKGE